MEKLLDENGGEWLVGKGFTWADLYVAVVLNHVSIFSLLLERGKVLNSIQLQWTKRCARMEFQSSKLAALSNKVYNIPKIKSYIENRPERPSWVLHYYKSNNIKTNIHLQSPIVLFSVLSQIIFVHLNLSKCLKTQRYSFHSINHVRDNYSSQWKRVNVYFFPGRAGVLIHLCTASMGKYLSLFTWTVHSEHLCSGDKAIFTS